LKRLTLLFIVFLTGLLNADEWQHYFAEGNHLYQQAEYEKAIERYEKIIDYGYESGELYFNLGNAYFKMNQIGWARLYYEKAALYLKNDDAVVQNLTMVKLRLVDQIESPPELFLSVWWNAVLNLFSMQALTILVILFLWSTLFIAGLRLYLVRRGIKDRIKSILGIVLLVFFVITIIFFHKIYIFETSDFGVILENKVTLRAEPGDAGTELFILHEGSKVEIIRNTPEWMEVRLEDGKTGWLKNTALEKI